MSADLRLTPIDLAHEAPFRLGGLDVRPAKLEVDAGDRRQTLEPRVMQVLVALARQRGEVVSRDDLIAACWAGRVVGEDSINRCISGLRRLAAELGGFELETIPRVGYRLSEVGADATPAARPRRRWPWIAATAAALAVALTAGAWIAQRSVNVQAAPAPRVAVSGFKALTDDPNTRALAAELADSTAGVLGEHALAVGQPTAAADMTLSGTVVADGATWRVRAHLDDRASGFTLWSQDFDWPAGQEAALRDQVTVAAVDAVFFAMDPLDQRGLRVEPRTVALYIRASKMMSAPDPAQVGQAQRLLEEVVARAPDFAAARGDLASQLAQASGYAPPADQPRLRARAEREAQRALATDLHGGSFAYDALYNLARTARPADIVAAEDRLLTSIAVAPEDPWLQMRECRLLIEVGRGREASEYCTRARALRPLAPPIDWPYAKALDQQGDLQLAARAADEAARFHPDHMGSRLVRFELEAFEGSPDRALALIPDLRLAPPVITPELEAAVRLVLKARQSRNPADADRALAALWPAARRVGDGRWLYLAPAVLGRPDDSFRSLDEFGLFSPFVGQTMGLLLDPAAASLRSDPRFWRAAAKAGYVAYWRRRNAWPDFCNGPRPALDCRKLAAQAGV